MGVTLSEIHQKARHSLLVVREGLERLERAESNPFGIGSSSTSPGDADLAQSVRRDLGQLQNYCADLDRLWRVQLPKGQRDLWKRRVEQVVEESDYLKSELDKFVGRQQRRQIEAQQRAELLQRRTGGDSALQIFDDEERARRSAQRSSNMIDDLLATGVAVLTEFAQQRDRLKIAQRKAWDILNTVGLSNSTLRMIERRIRRDRWIAYGGMVCVIFIVVLICMWLR